MTPNIVFDLGGVLVDFSERQLMDYFFTGLPEGSRQKIQAALFHSGLWRRMDRGDFDADGMVREVCALLPQPLHWHIEHMLPQYFAGMPPLPTCEAIPLLKARGQRVFLLSNSPYAFHREKHRIPYIDQFDGIFVSCDVHLLKPDPEIYLAFLNEFQLKAEDCLFIDDVQANIDAAVKLGMNGHCFADRDLEALARALGFDW